MGKRLKGRVVLITGANRGIGSEISTTLAKEAATIVLAARNLEKLKQTAEHIKQAGGKPHIVPVELAEEKTIIGLVKTIKVKLGRLDILINNAGVTHSAKLEDTKTCDWDKCFFVNARAPFILCRQALPILRKAPQAYIINIASVVAIKGYPHQSAYTASKHALRGMTMSLAEELKGSNIRVHLICTGGVNTEMVQRVRPDIKKDELIETAEIAELVLYLVTHKGNAVVDELRIRRASSSPWF